MNSKRAYLWLAVGAILLLFSNGKWIVPLAAWLAPVFIMRFTRTQKLLPGLTLSLLAYVVAFIVIWQDIIPMDGIFYYLIAGGIGLVFWLPYLADRLMAPNLKGLWQTLVFPLTWTTLEYISALTNPFASFGSVAYTQYGNLPLLQIVSVTGMWGLTFLICWFAPVVNWAWEQNFEWYRIRKEIGIYGGIVVFVLLFGGLRMVVLAPEAPTVPVAMVTTTPELKPAWIEAYSSPYPSIEACYQILDSYIDRSRVHAQRGVKMIVWDESGVFVPAGEEANFVDRGREFARRENIYLLMGIFVQTAKGSDTVESKVIWIEPNGEIAWEYRKSIIVPGDSQVAGDGQIKTQDTPHGNMAAAICFDLDQTKLIQQVGAAEADILLAPSDDWQAVAPLHTWMSSLRAIENGVSLVRPTGEGLSCAYDYQGRVLASTDYFTSGGASTIVHVPTQGIRTIYSQIGDLFAWLSMAGLVIVIGLAVGSVRKRGS